MAHENASRHGKAQTEGRCVFTGTIGADGAHLFPAGPFPQLADIPENIFAMRRDHHSVRGKPCFDWTQRAGIEIVRPVSERIWMLENLSMQEFRHIIHKKLRVVRIHCEAKGIDFPDAEKPADYEALIYQGG